jgi:hypothetical protein
MTWTQKNEPSKQLWSIFQRLSGTATDQLPISLQDLPSSNAMEMGQIMPAVTHE